MAVHQPVLANPYPVRVDAALDEPISRWLWLVKWLLVIPHYVVLFFLWLSFLVLSVAAFFAIVFTGRYPRSIFDFNVGVLRWTWRVNYYAYGALATDRYPPFSLHDVPDYPAHLEIDYPAHLSRGLVLVKWWLLAIPHYLLLAVFLGGAWFATRSDPAFSLLRLGLIGILVLIAAIALLFRGAYPRSIFNLVLGLQRWVLRVAAYSALMTDRYPPFRLDQGGDDPGPLRTAPVAPPAAEPWMSYPSALPPTRSNQGWTAGRVVAVVLASLLCIISLGLIGTGAVGLYADNALRDGAGYLTSPQRHFATSTYAVTSDSLDLRDVGGPDAFYAHSLLGDIRVRVTPDNPARSVFVGIARTPEVDAFLQGVSHDEVASMGGHGTVIYRHLPGTGSAKAPASQSFWVSSSRGRGTQTIEWPTESGSWTIVVMNASGAPRLFVTADIGATVPRLGEIATAALVVGLVLLAAGVLIIFLAIPRTRGGTTTSPAASA